MAKNSLSTLVNYTSDSDNEDAQNFMSSEVDTFLDEISQDKTKLNIPTTYWTECLDSGTGHPYYWNTETKEVTWEKPEEYDEYLKAISALSKITTIDDSWMQCYSEEKGTPYYVNQQTRVVSWEKPSGFIDSTTTAAEKSKSTEPTEKSKNDALNSPKQKKKKYPPWLENHSDDEKIELITSYTVASESSSEDETKNKVEPDVSSIKQKLNLVAAYEIDSDSDSESEADTNLTTLRKRNRKPNDLNNKIKPATDDKSSSPKLNLQKNSFASIITGGKIDVSLNDELNRFKEEIENDIKQVENDYIQNNDVEPIENISFDEKTFQRKRRIEFKTNPIITKTTISNSESSKLLNDQNSVDDKKSNLYNNFQKSHVEFLNQSATESNQVEINNKCDMEGQSDTVDDKMFDEVSVEQRKEIDDICELISGKLKFLLVDKPVISSVHIMNIQLETLSLAYRSGALKTDYFFNWIKSTSDDLTTLEQSAAPEGWKCCWDRSICQYCYKNIETGEILWKYPIDDTSTVTKLDEGAATCNPQQPDDVNIIDEQQSNSNQQVVEKDDDEMDISTTPPPNENEQIACPWTADNAPPPPIISYEPPPPGTDITLRSSVDINCELASFYSDLASMDPAAPTTEGTLITTDLSAYLTDNTISRKYIKPVQSQVNSPTHSVDNDSKIKKKSKKIKVQGLGSKMQEVSSMVANWKKAKKELGN